MTSLCLFSLIFFRKGKTWSHLSSLSSLPVNPLNPNPADLSSPSSAPLQKIIKRYACYSFSGKGYVCKPKMFFNWEFDIDKILFWLLYCYKNTFKLIVAHVSSIKIWTQPLKKIQFFIIICAFNRRSLMSWNLKNTSLQQGKPNLTQLTLLFTWLQ